MNRFLFTALSVATLGLTMATSANAIKPLELSELTSNSVHQTVVQLAAATPGQFTTVEQDHPTTGTASIVTENGQTYLVFDSEFTTAMGPDVNVILYKGVEVPVNPDAAEYVTIAPLQSFEGAQRYLIPADIDVNDYQAVGIWCRMFNVTFGYAPL